MINIVLIVPSILDMLIVFDLDLGMPFRLDELNKGKEVLHEQAFKSLRDAF